MVGAGDLDLIILSRGDHVEGDQSQMRLPGCSFSTFSPNGNQNTTEKREPELCLTRELKLLGLVGSNIGSVATSLQTSRMMFARPSLSEL